MRWKGKSVVIQSDNMGEQGKETRCLGGARQAFKYRSHPAFKMRYFAR
jgi:hypothetical protein